MSNVIAGGLSGAIASLVTLPLDVVKTRRQLYPKDYKNRSTYSILKDISANEGKEALFAGKQIIIFIKVLNFHRNETKSCQSDNGVCRDTDIV